MADENSHSADPAQLVLTKKGQRWIFRYTPGQEAALLQRLAATANDPAADFDWFDAAVISHQMGGQLSRELKKLMPDASSQPTE